mmetsp:Transcript_29227/g.28857  ORF Transcript_29227/g.28857 Transcript_29227/m.28857 type:complete len:145 (-) Transcript_29227:451-885(-)
MKSPISSKAPSMGLVVKKMLQSTAKNNSTQIMDKIPKKLTSTAFSQKKIQTKKSVDEDLEDTKEASSTTNMHSLSYLTNVEDSNVTIENFKLIKKVGKGTFGEVFKAVLKEEENKEDQIFEYAIKAIKRRMLQTADQMKYALSE